MLKKILILAVVLAFVSSAVFAVDTTRRYGNADRGRIVVDGKEVSVKGTLRYEAPVWYLDTADGSYALRLGNRNFMSESGIQLAEGAQCAVEGYQAGNDIAVSSMMMGGKTYTFRNQNGMPLWAGDGRQTQKAGRNRSNKPDSGQVRKSKYRSEKRSFDRKTLLKFNRSDKPGSGQSRRMSADTPGPNQGRGGQCDGSGRR